jgi:manganese/zinc/iron transport system permease protein
LNVDRIRMVLTSLVVLAVVIGIQAVGVLLIAAMLITPAAAARFWTDKIRIMILLASIFGAISGLTGAYISWLAPAMPTGPWIVVVISTVALISFFIAPRRGIISRLWKQQLNRRIINEENLLKALYQLGEEEKNYFQGRTISEIQLKRKMDSGQLSSILSRLSRQGYVQLKSKFYCLTEEGLQKGQRIVKLHRLWELYLTTKLNIAPDHVHDDADTMEHLITPELEHELEKQLGFPQKDPHASEIPYA